MDYLNDIFFFKKFFETDVPFMLFSAKKCPAYDSNIFSSFLHIINFISTSGYFNIDFKDKFTTISYQ